MSYSMAVERFDQYKKTRFSSIKVQVVIDEREGSSLFFRGVKVAHKTKDGRLFLTIGNPLFLKESRFITLWSHIQGYYEGLPNCIEWGQLTNVWDGTWTEFIIFKDGKTSTTQKYEG